MTKILAVTLAVVFGSVTHAYAGGKMQLEVESEGKSSQNMSFEQAHAFSTSKAKATAQKPKKVTSKVYYAETETFTNPAQDPNIACPSKKQVGALIRQGAFNDWIHKLTDIIANNQCHDYFNNNHQFFVANTPYQVMTKKGKVMVYVGCDNDLKFLSQIAVDKVYCVYTPIK